MLGDVFVVDGVLHGYHFAQENHVRGGELYANGVANAVYGFHTGYSPSSDPLITHRQMGAANDADFLAQMSFAESHADVAIYHGLPMFGWFRDGGSPMSVAREMDERWPGRIIKYGPISAHLPGALEEVDRLVEEEGVVALKLYPLDLIDGQLRPTQMDDPDIAYPIFERAQQLGLKVIAMHKAVPMGPVPLAAYRPDDVDEAAQAFPNLTFEIVHGGFAFLTETAMQIARFPNVTVNLEGTSAIMLRAPRKFAQIIGEIVNSGGADRIIWGTGAPVIHPRRFEEAMWDFQFPTDMIELDGIPELTPEMKRGILGENILRVLGIDRDDLTRASAGDEFSGVREHPKPWTASETVQV